MKPELFWPMDQWYVRRKEGKAYDKKNISSLDFPARPGSALILEFHRVAMLVPGMKSYWKSLVGFKESYECTETNAHSRSTSFFTWGMGKASDREASEVCEHLLEKFIGG